MIDWKEKLWIASMDYWSIIIEDQDKNKETQFINQFKMIKLFLQDILKDLN